MDDGHILETQRMLRRRLFEGESAIRWRPARELAAQLLLYVDDPRMCWQLAAEWVRATLDADRADGGFGGFITPAGASIGYVVMAESQRPSMALPPVLGRCFDPTEPSIREVWRNACLTPVTDVSQQRTMSLSARRMLLALGTASKLALPVSDGERPVGLLCADWNRQAPRWHADPCNEMTVFARDTLGPVLGASMKLAREQRDLATEVRDQIESADALTAAEARVARLVAQGLSYKEVARELGRSLSTVDHQLRSIRQKLGVRSTSRLVHLLSERGDR
ncbi:response regulator transcription factor [Piscinibacter sp.]|uniref:response regulator transcription factor n=1 Tax=Piscinibacter sp. TaxID=1903157 RepID=UPI002B77B24D|nr:helix-turn-helix transcriptional regulator [Albitalea sp.]HUG25424.1 helix-turn-helix transcriptional regulator [Albitalea sp.]